MKDFFHAINQIFSGVKALDETLKYQMISVIIAVPHFIYFMIFFAIDVSVLAVYNICIVIFYIGMAIMIGKGKHFSFVLISSFIEIMFHASLATVLLGWDWGFMTYPVGLVPMVFYMAFTLSYLKKRIGMPSLVSVVVAVVYFAILYVTRNNPPTYIGGIYDVAMPRVLMFNLFITFFFLMITSILFAIEIKFMQNYFETENDSLSLIANYDPLTRLMNRRSAGVFLKKVMEESNLEEGSFCLLMCDIDDFKKVNDTYGHSTGDRVLVSVARLLQDNVREEDFVCRWGGEEMLVFIRGNMEISRGVAERICSDIRNSSIENNNDTIRVTITVGMVEYTGSETIRDMIETADRRLYRGKSEGKNRVVWR